MLKFLMAVLTVLGFMALADYAMADHDNSPYFLTIIEFDDAGVGRLSEEIDIAEFGTLQVCAYIGREVSEVLRASGIRAGVSCLHVYDRPLEDIIEMAIEYYEPFFPPLKAPAPVGLPV